MKHTYYEFFAGGGMAHAGLGIDWKCLFANDISPIKCASYAENWGIDAMTLQDIKTVQSKQLEGVADLAWASFPCQDLSLAGNGAGLEGNRSGTFWPFIRLMNELRGEKRQPKLIALENVCGALTSRGGMDFVAIVEALTKLKYRVGAMVIDAAYFLPQSRPRLFILAMDSNLEIPLNCHSKLPVNPWVTEGLMKAYSLLDKEVQANWVWWQLAMPPDQQTHLAELIEDHPADIEWQTQAQSNQLMAMMSPLNLQKVRHIQKQKIKMVGTIYRRTRNGQQRAEVRFDGLAGCLRTPGGGSSRQTIIVVQGDQIRSRLLSAREAARLMGLPESYKLPARYNDAYHLSGDGVAVPVVAHLRQHLFIPILSANPTHTKRELVAQ
jgi:DNA (cytosine-5)-methyltransferase 1